VPPHDLLAIALVLAAFTVAHFLFWGWKLRLPSREDELLHVSTRDGWTLALGHCRPRGAPRRPPVLLVHGIAMNRGAFDFGLERWSLAAHLAAAGFDCYALDLRGHGGSRRGPGSRWSLDTYLEEDLPAALDAIRARTGAGSVLYVGHSQGALLGMAASALYPERIRALAALAPPVHFREQPKLRALAGLRRSGLGGHLRLLAQIAAPFSGYWHPGIFDLSVNLRNVEPHVYRRMLANGIEDLPAGVVDQFSDWIRDDAFCSCDHTVDYRTLVRGCRQPALFVSAEKDGLAPPHVVEEGWRDWCGPKQLWSAGADFGHTDLLLGRGAPETVFPVVRDFLLEHSTAADSR
jgi:pimeloyl-ACP methyl ester carboxylesterase